MRRGFTLIEALVSVVLLGVGVASVVGGLGHLTRMESMNRDRALLRRLVEEKYDELRATGELINAPLDGTFEDIGLEKYVWTLESEPTDVESLNVVRLIVKKSNDDDSRGAKLTTVVFTPPTTTEGGGTQ